MNDEERRIQSYLHAQAAKLTVPEMIAKVRGAMQELHDGLLSIPADRFADRPAPEEWSGHEVMAHVVSAGAHFGRGIVGALDGVPPATAGDEAPGAARGAREWWSRLERDREALFERVSRADPNARLERTIEHGMFGSLNWRETLLFLRLHDLDHAGQLRRIAAALG